MLNFYKLIEILVSLQSLVITSMLLLALTLGAAVDPPQNKARPYPKGLSLVP